MRRKSSPWTTMRTALTCTSACSRKIPNGPKRSWRCFNTMRGNNSGRGIGCISWDGQVHADQFWRIHTFGNVLERPFSQIWDDPNIELLSKLKEKKKYVGGRAQTAAS